MEGLLLNDEYSFLKAQHNAQNPWATLRLSYLLAKETNIEMDHELLDSIAKEVGIHKPLAPNHTNKIHSTEVKIELWKNVS